MLNSDKFTWARLSLELPSNTQGAFYLKGQLYILYGDQTMTGFFKLDNEQPLKRLAFMTMNQKLKQLATLKTMRSGITRSCLGCRGYIWVLGGHDHSGNPVNTVERYDPTEDKWTEMP